MIRDCLEDGDRDKIKLIIEQLCRDFAYAIHHPNSRNGGLIGLAAAAIALGQSEVIEYLDDIVHPVLACFGDQDARVRYYACESMYNISKVANGEILVYFNEVFDALSKLSADPDPSVQTGADLLNRLIKDIVAEKAATYVSVARPSAVQLAANNTSSALTSNDNPPTETSFNLPRFIPLFMERMYAINPLTRTFLLSWITLLDSIPDLEFISYLPSFLGGLMNFLTDSSSDIRVATHATLDTLLQEIKHNAEIKHALQHQRSVSSFASGGTGEDDTPPEVVPQYRKRRRSSLSIKYEAELQAETFNADEDDERPEEIVEEPEEQPQEEQTEEGELENENAVEEEEAEEEEEEEEEEDFDDIYIPGQDVHIDFDRILEILISHLDTSVEEVQFVVLDWVEAFLDISPLSMLPYVPRFLSVLLPTMDYEGKELKKAAERVNSKMMELIMGLPDESVHDEEASERHKFVVFTSNEPDGQFGSDGSTGSREKLDYSATVNALTLHFLDEKEDTRVAALDWLIMLHRKVPKRILAINDGTFPALLKTLSDSSEQVITRDLQLLAQISHNSDAEYFKSFMVNLLNLFSTDRRLLETRGNLIIRQLCKSLNPERIYWTLADILEREDEDLEFAGIMVQNLSNILITAPELSTLRMRLRSPNTKEGVAFFTALFKSWCHHPSAALALCLLSGAYAPAFVLLQRIIEFEITVPLLIEIDKLVQLLESPVFTHLRLQLLEPDKYPYLYKFLYGLLMILPQSSAFSTLRNRLNSVSSIGYLHVPQPQTQTQTHQKTNSTSSIPSGTSGKGTGSADSGPTKSSSSIAFHDVNWPELMDKFQEVQQKHQDMRNKALSRSLGELKLYEGLENGGKPWKPEGSGFTSQQSTPQRQGIFVPPSSASSAGISPVAATTTTASQNHIAPASPMPKITSRLAGSGTRARDGGSRHGARRMLSHQNAALQGSPRLHRTPMLARALQADRNSTAQGDEDSLRSNTTSRNQERRSSKK